MSVAAEMLAEAVLTVFQEGYGALVGATRERFGLAAAIVVAIAPWVVLALAIGGLVVWASG